MIGDGASSTLSFSSAMVRVSCRYPIHDFLIPCMILPAQEGEDVLESEQVQCARPVEETQPPPQDPRQRQVGLGIEKS